MNEDLIYSESHEHRGIFLCQLVAWGIAMMKDPDTHKRLEKIVEDYCLEKDELGRVRHFFDGLEFGRDRKRYPPSDVFDITWDHLWKMIQPFVVAQNHAEAAEISAKNAREDREAKARGARFAADLSLEELLS